MEFPMGHCTGTPAIIFINDLNLPVALSKVHHFSFFNKDPLHARLNNMHDFQ